MPVLGKADGPVINAAEKLHHAATEVARQGRKPQYRPYFKSLTGGTGDVI
jgi:hypothetical protein